MPELRYLKQLREKLDAYFDEEDLRTLCFDLGVQYDNLPGRAKVYKARELVALFAQNGRIPQLVAYCAKNRPNIPWTYQARFFLCYKRHAATDNELAIYLHQALSEQGHHVFIDQNMRAGTAWLDEIDQQIKASDFLLVLLSPESANSEMVQTEVYRAYEYSKQQGFPQILPVRIRYEGLLPYSIAAFVNPHQYVTWQGEGDNQLVAQQILQAINGRLPKQKNIDTSTFAAPKLVLCEDGQLITDGKQHQPPLPEFDPRFLEELDIPGEAVRLNDKFYVERDTDALLKRQITRPGSIITIRAPRQTGKSSLLVRGTHHARKHTSVINLDVQRIDRSHLASLESLLHYLANFIVYKLHLNPQEVIKAWQSPLGPQDKLTYLMEDYVFPAARSAILLAIDEADRLLETPFYEDFFSLLRSWHNSAAHDERWEKLIIVMAISTEPYLLIANTNRSPFNVGLKLYLKDFTTEQVRDLNRRHGSPVRPANFPEFMTLLNGHPYLTRKALYTLVTEKMAWADFMAMAARDEGPFSDHLRRQQWLLRNEPQLQTALKQILHAGRCNNETARFHLLRMGLIAASGDSCASRCHLYHLYFRDKL